MKKIQIWHNPRCTKSRETLELLKKNNVELEIVPYLDEPPSPARLDEVLRMLGLEPRDLMRKKETAYKDLSLDDTRRTRKELIQAMVENPILIERPVVIAGKRAALGRPPERVLEIL
jgi:arsenate reductase (glutaredoxin)